MGFVIICNLVLSKHFACLLAGILWTFLAVIGLHILMSFLLLVGALKVCMSQCVGQISADIYE